LTHIVATVDGQPIALAAVEQRIADLRTGPLARQLPLPDGPGHLELCRWIVRELVAEAIVAAEAQRLGVASADVPAAVTADVTVSEREVRAFYARNADLYHQPEARVVDWPGIGRVELRRGEHVGPLEEAVFAAGVGDSTGPLPLDGGAVELRLLAIVPGSIASYETVRDSIERELLAAARLRVFADWLERRRQEVVVVDPEWEHPDHPVHGVPSHRH
jgi:[acyl-carrier-protein] S-malonyltransferase